MTKKVEGGHPEISIKDRLRQIHEESVAAVMDKHGPYSQAKVDLAVQEIGNPDNRTCPTCRHDFRPTTPEQYFCCDSCRLKRFTKGLWGQVDSSPGLR